jgi:hypothetical protein
MGGGTVFTFVNIKHSKNLLLKSQWARKADIYMKAF